MPDTLAADDLAREPTLVRPDDPELMHLALVGDTYTVLVSGADTGGRFAVMDMLIPPGGGPPRHRHAFEELFHILEGELEVTVRDRRLIARAGDTVNVPSNAPHSFRNVSDRPARTLTTVVPAGLEAFFARIADHVPSRTSPAPELSPDAFAERMRLAASIESAYGIETGLD